MPESLRPLDVRFREPLSEVTRKERTALLAVSAISIAISSTGLIPTKISALGIEFNNYNQIALLWVFQGIVIFFMCAFVFYGSFDFAAWRSMWHDSVWNSYLSDREAESKNGGSIASKEAIKMAKLNIKWWRISTPIIYIRCLFEFFVPLIVSIIALFYLHLAKQKVPKNAPPPSSISIQRPNP